MLNLQERMWVEIEPSANMPEGVWMGQVRGIAQVAQPIVGRLVIVEVTRPGDHLTDEYPFSCVAIHECHLKEFKGV
ncbi:hypothetical protein [Ralstonia phage RSP15]|uniref:hypothetical protein n=1 Tax=Ralstonia phage RSP15 TaxID=1785960 RepID=UPI00074D313C|nr:hypothetical protein BH754_gp197 [Ralstonia phage RSP15]BAU40109.1 hypothetical protein [Ralstonia phage RSP15]